jgi:hypothetical protein
MVKKKPSWQEKLHDSKGGPKVSVINEKLSKSWGKGTVVIPAPMEVDGYMRQVPKGKLITINDIRQALAIKHKTTIGCPITTGIFAWIAAPYWRTLKTGGMINEKYPGGAEAQKVLLEQEGHAVIKKGKNYVVKDYLKALATLN